MKQATSLDKISDRVGYKLLHALLISTIWVIKKFNLCAYNLSRRDIRKGLKDVVTIKWKIFASSRSKISTKFKIHTKVPSFWKHCSQKNAICYKSKLKNDIFHERGQQKIQSYETTNCYPQPPFVFKHQMMIVHLCFSSTVFMMHRTKRTDFNAQDFTST